MRIPIALAFLVTSISITARSTAQSTDSMHAAHHDHAVTGGGTLPAGWSARTDGTGDIKNVKFVVMEPGYHLTLGPATILYRNQDQANGPFHATVTIHQMKKLEHPEGYGILFGGKALTAKGQQYTYFLVRDDGTYLLKRRDGEKTTEISKGWTPHPAIKKAGPDGKASNVLEVDAKKDPRKVDFKVNGQSVYTADAGTMDLKGIVGLRVNHNLDVHIQDFALHQ